MIATCWGCKKPINSRFMYNILDRKWHEECLICDYCHAPLGTKCFSKEGRLYCRKDYFNKFGKKCGGCGLGIDASCLIRKGKGNYFHLDCFKCYICKKKLETGDHFYNGSKILCMYDYENQHYNSPDAFTSIISEDEDDCIETMEPGDLSLTSPLSEQPTSVSQNPQTPLTPNTPKDPTPIPPSTDIEKVSSLSIKEEEDHSDDDMDTDKCLDDDKKITDDEKGNKRRGPRTTIKAKQLEILKTAFNKTPKPTRHIREQLAKDTGLPMRVIQVWFQNKRSKERRMKQLSSMGMRGGNFFPNGRKLREMSFGIDESYLFQNYNGFPGQQFPNYFSHQPLPYPGAMGPGMEQPLPPGGPMGDFPPMANMNNLMGDQFEPHPNMASPTDDMQAVQNGPTGGFSDHQNSAVLAW